MVNGGIILCFVIISVRIWRQSPRVYLVGFGLALLLLWLRARAIDRALAKEFQEEYATYKLNPKPGKTRRLYLRYILFLDRLVEKHYTREDIAKLREITEIAELPKLPAIQFTDHPILWLV